MKALRWKGARIATAGAYVGLPIDIYHTDPCEGRFVTASALKRADRSMLHFWSHCAWNPDREPPDTDSTALRLGKASHVLAFEPELFDKQFRVCPFGDDYRNKDAAAWKKELPADILPIKPREYADMTRQAAALRAHPEAGALFKGGLPEMTFAAKDEATSIWRLTRPDFTPAAAGRGLVDYKTAANASYEAFGRAAFDYGYHLQVALALDVVAEVTGEMRPCFWMVVQEKEAPFAVSIHRWEPDQIMYGRRRVRELLDRIAYSIETSEWPGYGPAQSLVTPSWIAKEIEREANV